MKEKEDMLEGIRPLFQKDNLDLIFESYKKYHGKYFVDKFDEKFPDTEQRVSALCVALIHEAVELQRLTNWKWWKQPVQFNVALAQEELIDILHFFVAIAVVLDITPEKLVATFLKKLDVNIERQKNNY